MAGLDEALNAKSPMGSDLAAGLDALSANQEITFFRYIRLTLPIDGFVFWVRADIVKPGALLNAYAMNSIVLNGLGPKVAPSGTGTFTPNFGAGLYTGAASITVKGSLHYATDRRQEQEETYSVNSVIFSAEKEVNDLNAVGPNVIFIATLNGIKYAFGSRGRYYAQADVYHYSGEMVYPDMQTQIIDPPAAIDTRSAIVSNSLPLWLKLNGYMPSLPAYGFGNPSLMLYPSFLLPANISPPFASVHIDPLQTSAIASTPFLDRVSTHSQLQHDRVKITIFGQRNSDANDFLDCVYQWSQDYDLLGLMNSPVIRDEKRTQRELSTIAMKKSIEFEVNYYSGVVRNIARQLIEQVDTTVTATCFVPPTKKHPYTDGEQLILNL